MTCDLKSPLFTNEDGLGDYFCLAERSRQETRLNHILLFSTGRSGLTAITREWWGAQSRRYQTDTPASWACNADTISRKFTNLLAAIRAQATPFWRPETSETDFQARRFSGGCFSGRYSA